MKTIKWPYIIKSSRLFIFRSQIIFGVHLQLQLCTSTSITSWWRHFINRQVEVEDGLQKYFWDRQTIFTVAKYDKSSLGCLHATRSMWATRALELILSFLIFDLKVPSIPCQSREVPVFVLICHKRCARASRRVSPGARPRGMSVLWCRPPAQTRRACAWRST